MTAVLHIPPAARAAHPLITDDAGTQGKGKYQLELNGEYGTDRQTVAGVAVESTAVRLNTTVTVGASDTVDVLLDVPHQWNRVDEEGTVPSSESGMSDISIGAKWRFFENGGLNIAIKPAVSPATGDENKGLGAGKTGYSVFLILDGVMETVAFFANIGFIRNDNTFDQRKNLLHASVASTYEAAENLSLAINIGMEMNPDDAVDEEPAFGLIGVIYGFGENLHLDAGVKFGLNETETDRTLLAGVTMRFR